jgi:hypothetical protein
LLLPRRAWTVILLFYTFHHCWDDRRMSLYPAFFWKLFAWACQATPGFFFFFFSFWLWGSAGDQTEALCMFGRYSVSDPSFCFFETGICYVVQVGIQLAILLPQSWVLGFTESVPLHLAYQFVLFWIMLLVFNVKYFLLDILAVLGLFWSVMHF